MSEVVIASVRASPDRVSGVIVSGVFVIDRLRGVMISGVLVMTASEV